MHAGAFNTLEETIWEDLAGPLSFMVERLWSFEDGASMKRAVSTLPSQVFLRFI